MAWIETIPGGEGDSEVGSLLDTVADSATGRVDAILQIHSLNPRALAAHNALYKSAMAGTANLRKVDRELVAFVVSQANDCHY
jgi:alkylhydroperoxidase family enzyme